MTVEQANALIQRADLAVNESESAVQAAKIAHDRAIDANRQAREMRALVRQIIPAEIREQAQELAESQGHKG